MEKVRVEKIERLKDSLLKNFGILRTCQMKKNIFFVPIVLKSISKLKIKNPLSLLAKLSVFFYHFSKKHLQNVYSNDHAISKKKKMHPQAFLKNDQTNQIIHKDKSLSSTLQKEVIFLISTIAKIVNN